MFSLNHNETRAPQKNRTEKEDSKLADLLRYNLMVTEHFALNPLETAEDVRDHVDVRFATPFTVGNNVDAGMFLQSDDEAYRIVRLPLQQRAWLTVRR